MTTRLSIQNILLVILAFITTACSDGNDNPPQESTVYQQFYSPAETSIEVHALDSGDAGKRYYIDEGDPNGIPVLLVTGTGTSVTAALLTSHLNALRDQLGIRIISVQRNGFGQSNYQETWGYRDYVDDVERVLEALGIQEFHVFAISGGGPYTAFLAESLGDRILSLHLAATITGNNVIDGNSTLSGTLGTLCTIATNSGDPIDTIRGLVATYALSSSQQWWGFEENNPMLAVKNFEAAAAVDWEYTFFSHSSDEALSAFAAEINRYCTVSLPDLANVTAPLFVYYGEADTSASQNNVDAWIASLANAYSIKVRLYPEEGHWVQYNHLEQIYTDIAQPGNLVVCSGNNETRILPETEGQSLLDSDMATPGTCIEPTN
ncbi:MAG: alpha/beta hydrolase [Halioglobus sp.]